MLRLQNQATITGSGDRTGDRNPRQNTNPAKSKEKTLPTGSWGRRDE